jgi:hypothetical protein
LRHSRVLAMLHNPAYAGTYVYGRTQSRTRLLPGETPRIKGRTRRVNREDWPIVLVEAHPGYISWEQFLRNQHRLDDNRTFRDQDRRAAVREGAALLQGIVLCGACGRRMSVRYLADGRRPQYECNQVHTHLAGKTCQSLRGDGIDAAVAQVFLQALTPAHLEVSLAALEQLEERARQIDRQWQLRLERARYEADLARRRFLNVEPENRLVARSLERDWNAKLAAVEQLERDFVTYQAIRSYLQNERGAEYDADDDGDRVERTAESIGRLTSRLETVTESNLARLRDTDRVSLGEFRLFTSVDVLCTDCGSQYTVEELLERGGCDCEDVGEE